MRTPWRMTQLPAQSWLPRGVWGLLLQTLTRTSRWSMRTPAGSLSKTTTHRVQVAATLASGLVFHASINMLT